MKNLPTVECSMLEAFEDTLLGNLNIIERDGTLYVPAIETAMILGYRNPRDAICRHCVCDTITIDEWVITGKKVDGSDAIQCVHKKYINESDFYRLLFHSRLPSAEEFTRWICEEVLPHIRRYICRLWKMPLRVIFHMQKRWRSAIRFKNFSRICRERHPHVVIREETWNCNFSDNSCRSRWIYPAECGIVLY